jgi:hypothetical protein
MVSTPGWLFHAGGAAMLAAGAMAAAAQQPVVVQSLECRGDEPAWKIDATRSTANYTTLGPKGKREVVFRGSLQPLAFLAPPAIVWRGDSTHLPRETLVVTLREEACRSTLADGPPVTHRAVLSLRPGEAVAGCCSVRAGFDARSAPVADFATKTTDDWSRALPDLLPAIGQCLTREGARVLWVAKAWPVNAGMAGVRIVESGGAAIDCITDASGRGTPTITAVAATAPALTGAGNPRFLPAREPPPIIGCGRLERALSPRGALQGYLHYDPC